MKLVAAHALFAAGDKENRLEPHVQLDMAGLENGADSHAERLAAVAALVNACASALALHLVAVPDNPALGADRALRPELGFHELVGGCFIVEVWGGEDGFHVCTRIDSVCSIIYNASAVVNWTAYMNFKTATDALFEGVNHGELADKMGVSIPAIRQARLDERANAHRNPPDGWERAVRALAENRIRHYQKLVAQLGK